MGVRIAVVADIHHGAISHTKRGDRALELLSAFARFADEARADLVLDLGDRISDVDAATDRALTEEVRAGFAAIEAPVHHLSGNHDRVHLSVADNERILGSPLGHAALDVGGWCVLLWRADTRLAGEGTERGFSLPEEDLLWLERTVRESARPTLVASHLPVSGHSQIGNHYFERNPALSTYRQTYRVRAALARATVPLVCLAGHVHWNTVTQVDGVAHLTQQSLTESFTTAGEPAAAWGLLELGDTLHWRVHGEDPFELGLTPAARRWPPPLAPFGRTLEGA